MRCVPIDQDEPTWCLERSVDTWEIGEFSYIVERDVWLAAVPWNTAGGMFDFHCIGCLEGRLGRRRTAHEFPDPVPMTSIRGIGGATVCGNA